ncbi:hypothetical protein Poly30_29970 [Planctomycetes bacterium Poly30]|uniref:Uncharacterized protein n=1 Tax=Saltatorellus ferox TaxID=2528018 RepID=A0A518ETQ1_9BACT|nr:hypothetical protein Poly30_29970 [Planctomycetes bacterium Poly30]
MADDFLLNDPRVATLRDHLTKHGVLPGSGLDSGLRSCRELEEVAPGTFEAALDLSLRLAADGIDPERVLSYGVPAAIKCRGAAAEPVAVWLEPVESFVRSLHASEIELWSAISYGVRFVSRLSEADLEVFRGGLARYGETLLTLRAQGTDTSRLVTSGSGALGEVLPGHAWALEPVCRLAERVGGTPGGEPGWIWSLLVSEWARVLLNGEDSDRATFVRTMELLGDFLERVPDAGMHVGSRIADGVVTFARYGPGMVPYLGEWFDLVLALIRSMKAQGMSPYLCIGNGLGGIIGEVAPGELSEVLRFAVSLADRGIDPGGILYEAFMPAAYALGAPMAIELGRRLANEGFDPFTVLESAAPAIGSQAHAWPEEERADLLAECLELLTQTALSLHAIEGRGQKYFVDAVPYMADRVGGAPAELLDVLRMGARLAEQGVSPGMTFAYGWPTVLNLGEAHPWLPGEARGVVEELGGLGVDPEKTLSSAFPVLLKVAGDEPEEFRRLCRTLVEVITALEAAGVDPRSVLYRHVSAMADVRGDEGADAFRGLLGRLRALLLAMAEGGVSPAAFLEAGLPAAAREAREEPWRLDVCLDWATGLAKGGRDGAAILEHATAAIAGVDRGEPARFKALLGAVEKESQRVPDAATKWFLAPAVQTAASMSGGDPASFEAVLDLIHERFELESDEDPVMDALASALPLLAEIAGEDAGAFGRLLEAARLQAERMKAADRWPANLLWYALRVLRSVSAGQPEEAVLCLTAVADRLIAEPVGVGLALVRQGDSRGYHGDRAPGLEVLAQVTDGDPAGFRRGLPLLFDVARLFRTEDAEDAGNAVDSDGLRELLRFAAAVPPATLVSFEETLTWLGAQLGGEAMRDSAARLVSALSGCTPLVRRWPSGWSGLIRPAIAAHGPRSTGLLRSFRWVDERWLQQDSDLRLLGEIVTQFGVRVPEIMDGLILPGLRERQITDLTGERALLLQFLREVPLAEPQVYERFRAIQQDSSLSETQKREAVEALHGTLLTLSESVRAGEVSREEMEHPLFPLVLYHVFPPAMSTTRDQHVQNFASFDDHEDHVLERDPGEHRRRRYSLRQGAWEQRPGVEIDRSHWAVLMEAAAEVGPGTAGVEPTSENTLALGWDLLARWAEGRIGRDVIQRELLGRVLVHARAGGVDLPSHADTPTQLIECKEFLGDHVRDVVEQCLIAARKQDPARYDRLVQAKFAPDTSIGAGLVKSMWSLAQEIAAQRVSGPEVTARLERQLRHFVVDPAQFPAALAACKDRDEVRALLQSLVPVEVKVEVGKEQARLMADFVGQASSAMHRELYGGDGQPAKLVYVHSSSAPPMEITLELSKRKAHAPIGLCEGVCVATDKELWNRPDFFQVIFWGPDGIAAGGMHVLIVEEEGVEYVTLPGINPSLRFLDAVEISAVLDVAIDYAWQLARRWGCAGVWVPTSTAIHSNRRAVQMEMARRRWGTRATSEHLFSFHPYRYTFREVFEVREL